jgi:hypothetical protein
MRSNRNERRARVLSPSETSAMRNQTMNPALSRHTRMITIRSELANKLISRSSIRIAPCYCSSNHLAQRSNPIQPRPVSRNIAWSPLAPRLQSRARAGPNVLQLSSSFFPVVERRSTIGRLARYDNQSQTRASDGSDGKVVLTAPRILLEWTSNTAFLVAHCSRLTAACHQPSFIQHETV